MENNQTSYHGWSKDGDGNFCLRKFIIKIVGALILLLVIGLIVNSGVKNYAEKMNPNTIVISGTAKVLAVPDISTINFTVRASSQNNNTKALQDEIAIKAGNVFSKLEDLGIDRKDIQTSNYSVTPKYSYRDCSRMAMPCESSYVSGYEASEGINVKVRDTENVSKILNILAEERVTEVYGPNFEVDNIESLKDQARNLAIKDAREKAGVLANSLGVKIDKIVSFSDASAGYVPMPMMANQARDAYATKEMMSTPMIEQGEQEIVSNVAITFQIRN